MIWDWKAGPTAVEIEPTAWALSKIAAMNVVLTQPVEIALRSLSDEDRRKMSAWLDHLRNWENDPHVRKQSHKLESSEGVYVLRTSTDLRIFFSLQEDQIVVLDIARKGTIMSFGPLAEHGKA